MSMDTVDDLHAAEDALGTMTMTMQALLRGDVDARANAVEAVRDAILYCRPTCGKEGKPHTVDDGEDIDCGCPCHT